MAKPYLVLRNVVKSYDGAVNAVEDVSFAVERGEFLTLLGPSGSGKTTTLMMIAGFEYPDSGVIELEGRDLVLRKPYARNIGMVFQNYALFPHMTVLRNVVFPLRMRRFPRAEMEARARKMLELVGLSALSERYPRELSGGQQQRVALARGLVFNPDVLLLDEPLGALDKNLREQMQVEIKRIHRELNITMIYVTHDQTEAMTMSDRVAVFRHGRVEQIASPLEVYRRPATRFVGEFVGDSNFFAGRLDPSRPGAVEVAGLGTVWVPRGLTDHVAAGAEVDVLVRPERVRIADRDNAALANRFKIVIESVINHGDSILAVGRTDGGAGVRVRVAGAEPQELAPGAQVEVAWAPPDAHVLARAQG